MLLGCVGAATLVGAPAAAAAQTPKLLVGVGRADITPVTGVYKGGWACTCATAVGQQERLYARVVVLKEGSTKLALVAEDLFAVPAGMIRDAAALDSDIGLGEQNVIDSATHTHSSQSGYMNNSGDNLILPSDGNLDLSHTTGSAADPVMYSFMTRQLALAIRRANADLKPGAEGWGETQLLGVTENRSLGAHLADYGVTNAGPQRRHRLRGPGRLRGHDRPTRQRPSRRPVPPRQATRAMGHPPRPGRGLLDVRQPRHRRPRELPLLRGRPPGHGRTGRRGGDPCRRRRTRRPGRRQRVREQRRGRHDRRDRPRRPRRGAVGR